MTAEPSVDVLAAQVRELKEALPPQSFLLKTNAEYAPPGTIAWTRKAVALLDALVARVTEAERGWKDEAERLCRAEIGWAESQAALADARNALERMCIAAETWDATPELVMRDALLAAREVLARLDGSSE